MQDSKKILIFSTAYYPFVGGAEVAIKEITDRIPDMEFDLITARFSKKIPFREKIGNVTVYRLGIGVPLIDKLLLPFEGALFARHLQKKNNYKYFWCIMATFASGAAYIFNIFSSKKVPIILNLQEGDSEEHFAKRWFGLINLSWRMALKRTSYLTVLSQFLKDRAERFGYRGKTQIIPNGVNLNIFQHKFNLQGWQKAPTLLNDSLGYVFLWTFSRITEKNGIKDIIKAVSLLNSKSKLHNKFKLLVIGEGYLKNELLNLAESEGVSNQVYFLGQKNQSEIVQVIMEKEKEDKGYSEYINVWHIFVRPSLSEGFGNAFIEAMAVGMPVIATNIGGIPDFLEDYKTGLFCEPNNPRSINEKVLEYINNPQLTEDVTKNARKMVEERYDWDKIAPEMKKVFEA